jgi:DNA-binding GntR family transcriptional regulator
MDSAESIHWRSRVRLVDEVVDVIRDRIYDGRYAPGAPIRQEHLAAELNVSRTPLREALRMLEREGLVKATPGKGMRVVSAEMTTLLAAYELREVVDGLAARLSAERGGEPLIDALEATLAAQRVAVESWDAPGYTAANVAFHRAIIEATQNEYVTAQLPLVRMTSQVFTPIKLVDRDRAAEAVTEHTSIAAAIAAGDSAEAERHARLHIRRTLASLADSRDG